MVDFIIHHRHIFAFFVYMLYIQYSILYTAIHINEAISLSKPKRVHAHKSRQKTLRLDTYFMEKVEKCSLRARRGETTAMENGLYTHNIHISLP